MDNERLIYPMPNHTTTALMLNTFKERIKNLVSHISAVGENANDDLVYEEITRTEAETEAGLLCDFVAHIFLQNLAGSKVYEKALKDGKTLEESLKPEYLIPEMEKETKAVFQGYIAEKNCEEYFEENEEINDESGQVNRA